MRDEGIPTANSFAHQIEEIVWMRDVTYIDAVVIWCADRGLEPEMAATLVKKSAPLKSKIQAEAENLRMMVDNSSGNTLFDN